MTLEQILNNYKTERYKLYSDIFNNTKVSGLIGFSNYLDYFENYLEYYKTINDIEKLIEHSVKGLFVYKGKLYVHPHQKVYKDRGGNDRGITDDVSREVIDAVLNDMDKLETAIASKKFSCLYEYVRQYKVQKFGGSEIYDTVLRIGIKYDIHPKEVYLHGASLIGLKAIESKRLVQEDLSLKKTILISELPECFAGMEATHIEDFLNLKKVDLMKM